MKFLCKLDLTKSYKRKHKGMFFSEHSVVTAEPSFTVKTIDWVHQTGPRKAV